MSPLPSRTLSVTINRDWREVYAYASDPANMREWAAGLGGSFEPSGDEWLVRDPGGKLVRMRFAGPNDHGVLDHDVITGDGTVHVAMRVVPNEDGAEVTFLLLQTPGMSDDDFRRDGAAVQADLDSLKALMERRAGLG